MKALPWLATIVVLGIPGVNALALELPLPFDTELGRQYRNEVDSLLVPADRLPPECHLAHDMTSAPIFPATTNPFVTDNPQLIGFVAAIGFRNIAIDQVRVALTALYIYQQPRYEVGVWGLHFVNQEMAREMYKSLNAPHVWIRGPLLVTVWQDNAVSQPCYEAILSHLKKSGFARPGSKP